jgi:hypothetical protein
MARAAMLVDAASAARLLTSGAGSYDDVVRFVTWPVGRHRLLTAVVVASAGWTLVPVGLPHAHSQTAVAPTWIYDPSGARLGMYALHADDCDHAEIWWEPGRVGRVLISGNPRYSYAYARRISRDYWRLAEVIAGYPHAGTLKRAGKRWALRNKKGRIVIYASGPNAIEAALAYLTFGRECTTLRFP